MPLPNSPSGHPAAAPSAGGETPKAPSSPQSDGDGKRVVAGAGAAPHDRRVLRRIALVCVVVPIVTLLLLVGGALWQIEDWGRDLTTNFARTDSRHAHPGLHPVTTEILPRDVADAVRQVAATLPGWRVVSVHPIGDETRIEESIWVADLVRTTRLFRFQDDVSLTIVRSDHSTDITAMSRSRVGVGDLGQNPRNIREILGALRVRLAEMSQGRQA